MSIRKLEEKKEIIQEGLNLYNKIIADFEAIKEVAEDPVGILEEALEEMNEKLYYLGFTETEMENLYKTNKDIVKLL